MAAAGGSLAVAVDVDGIAEMVTRHRYQFREASTTPDVHSLGKVSFRNLLGGCALTCKALRGRLYHIFFLYSLEGDISASYGWPLLGTAYP